MAAQAEEIDRKQQAVAERKRAEDANKPLRNLTVGEVEALFENTEKPSSLVSYSVSFREKDVDGDMLSRVDSEDVILNSLPLTNILHARQLLECIEQWKKEGVPKVKLVKVSSPRIDPSPSAQTKSSQSASSSPSSRSVAPPRPPPPPPDPLVFSDNYTIDGACFDSGGNAEVFKAARNSDSVIVAVKQFKLPANPTSRKKILDSAQTEYAVRVRIGDYPYLMPADGLFYDDKKCYLVMPLARGGSAQKRLDCCWDSSEGASSAAPQARFSPSEAVSVGYCVASALARLHQLHVQHLDVKPANILFKDAEGDARSAVLTDFGTARYAKEVSKSVSSGSRSGTIPYMAPEIICTGPLSPNSTGTEKSDVWSFGAMLLTLLTGYELGCDEGGARSLWDAAYARNDVDWGGELFLSDKPEDDDLAIRAPFDDVQRAAWKATPKELRDMIVGCFKLKPDERPTAQDLLKSNILVNESLQALSVIDKWSY